MELKIYDKQGLVKMTVSPDNSSQWNHEVGVENVVTLNFTTWEFLVLEVGWYILVEGQRFSIKSEYRPKHIHDTKYTYNLKFYGREHDTQDILFCRLNQGEDDLESVFAYDGTPMDFLLKVVANMNRNTEGVVWKAGEAITSNRQTINFNGLYCWDALGEIARAFGTEWWMDGEYLNLSKCVRGESVSLGYGEGLKSGLTQNENTNAVKWFTRLIPVGSSKNIDKSTYGYANLQLPGREKYIDINTQYGLKEYREEAAFSEIYPHRVGTISSVRSETKTNEETGDYTVYYVKDSDLPFNPDEYMIDGKVINMTFNTGALAGKEFEVNWDNENGEFEIINQYPDVNTQLPGNYLVPSVGDAYVLSNISMPWNYNQAAEIAFEEAVEAYLSEYAKDVSIYSGNTDYIYVANNNVPLLLGQRVRLISEVYFGNDGRESRITRVSRKLNNLGEASIDCSDAIASSWKSSVDSSLNQLQFVYSSQKEGATDKNLHILQTGDTGAPSDYNVYSALRSNKTFIRKDIPDSTPYPLGVGGLSFKGKDILRYIRYYDEDKPEVVTDVDIYSALMTEERIKAGTKDLDNRYLRKDKEDTAHKHITFEGGITVYELAKMMKLEVAELATIARAIVDVLGSSKFVDGFFGEGYQIWKSIATGDWCMTLDRLTVRKVMTVYEHLIQKIRFVGGMIVVSAGNGKIKEVGKVGLEYKMTFEDTNTFAENDLMRCQVWTGTGVKYYWVEVVRVDGDAVYTRVADYDGVIPEAGDEVVLMGNTKNKLRQNLLILSATEDGQPRFDCLDGVRTKNFEGCLRTRVGCLDGISDDQFPPGLQPQGYGLYADNCYLRGAFVLSNGKDVQTQFSILEGMVRASMSSVQQQINAEDNYLSNASMTSNLEGWEYDNNVKVFRTSGGLLHFNRNFYSIKKNEAGIVPDGEKVVLRLKNSYIRQKNVNFSMHPTFDLVEQTTTDADGNEIGTGIKLYRPRMFYVSFRYLVKKRGTLRVYFEGEENRSDFEDYAKLNYTKVMDAGESFVMTDDSIAGKWNGTGDFYLSFDGEIYLYDLALADDPLSDMEERWNMKFELTEKKLELNFEHIKQQGDDLEAFYSEYQRTAEESLSRFTAIEDKADSDYKFLQGEIKQTASNLEISYTELIGATKEDITEDYKSAIDVSAREITAELTAELTDLESGLKSDYTTLIETRAGEITAELTGQINDLVDGDISMMKTSIEANTKGLSSKVEETVFNALGERVSNAESLISQTASDITLMVRKDGVISSINQSAETISIKASKIDLLGQVTFSDLAAGLQNTIDGKVDETTIISGNYIKTGLIDTESLIVKRIHTEADNEGFIIKIENGTLQMTREGLTAVYMQADNYVPALWFRDGSGNAAGINSRGFYIQPASNSDNWYSFTENGINLGYKNTISNFAIGTFGKSMSGLFDFVDIGMSDSAVTLPKSANFPGKVIFVKCNGNVTFRADTGDKIMEWGSYNKSDSVRVDGSSLFFISNGSGLWYGFICH